MLFIEIVNEIVHCLLMIPHALNNATVQNLTVKYYREIQCTPLRGKHCMCQSVHFFNNLVFSAC